MQEQHSWIYRQLKRNGLNLFYTYSSSFHAFESLAICPNPSSILLRNPFMRTVWASPEITNHTATDYDGKRVIIEGYMNIS